MFEHFERQVDPDGALSEKERAKLAENARQAQLAGARRKALKVIRERKEPPAEKSGDTLASTLANIIATVELSSETRQRISELLGGGDGV